MKTSIQFINHASVVVSDGNTSVLSDPWYTGDAFHKGWNLLHETSTQEVLSMLDAVVDDAPIIHENLSEYLKIFDEFIKERHGTKRAKDSKKKRKGKSTKKMKKYKI